MSAMPCVDVAGSSPLLSQKDAVRRQIPSQRNRDVFAAVAMGKSHAEVASEFGLTQPRVTQIVRQVREWSTQAAGGELGEYNEVQRLRLAEETLRIQFDSAIRMAMQEWRKSRREGLGRATYLTTTMRLSSNLARLSGVDVSGKTARLMAEQQEREERASRAARLAEKPLWAGEPQVRLSEEHVEENVVPSPAARTVCDKQPVAVPPEPQRFADEKNSYGLAGPAAKSAVAQAMLEHITPATPAISTPRADKPIPKFLDKKARKRLLALWRREALGAVG